MYFETLQSNLVEILRMRVRSGEISERRLARLSGVSQPHIHNVLKGTRLFSIASSDRILRELQMTVPELISGEGEEAPCSVPVIEDPLGPLAPYPRPVCRGRHPIAASLVEGLTRPIVYRLCSDPQMEPDLQSKDLVLVDQNEAERCTPDYGSIYLLCVAGRGLARYVRREGGVLYLGTAQTRGCPELWQSIKLEGQDILELIRGRIVWIGREMETSC